MSNLVFPSLPGLVFPVRKTPMWSTNVQTAVSGKEVRIANWSYPRWKWNLEHELLRDKNVGSFTTGELHALLAFFNTHMGSWDDWLFNDPDDNAVVDESFGTGDGTTTQFQLKRAKGGFVEPIKNVNYTVAPVIKKAGVTQTLTTHYSINAATGVVTFVTAPAAAAALTWTGGYYWRCRFMEDATDVEKFANLMWESGGIEFMSVKQ